MKVFLLAALAFATVSADPSGYGYWGQHSWPSYHGYGVSSTCWGCRYRRDADETPAYGAAPAPAEEGRALAQHPNGATSFIGNTVWGKGKREAEPSHAYGPAPALAWHPHGATSYVGNTVWGRGKREAEPSYHHYGYGPAIAHHPYGGTSYVGRTVWGLRGKREAEAEPGYAYGYGYRAYGPYGHAYGHSYGYPAYGYGHRYGYGYYH